ncbi:MAG: hypothetical protein HN790_17300 [Methylococcales bacterium]|jgi:hypothetical protein|nr:hypothetical protein [Methylococcales bacterium]
MRILLIILPFLLIGCAHVQEPIPMEGQYVTSKVKNIGIVVSTAQGGNFVPFGNIGLLDLAVIAGSNSQLTDHLEALDVTEFQQITEMVTQKFQHSDLQYTIIPTPVAWDELPSNGEKQGFATKDFSQFKQEYKVDHILVLRLVSVGVKRSYYSIAPTSPPTAYASIEGALISLKDHSLKWYYSDENVVTIPDPWDEPDLKFPNVTSSVYQIINTASETLVDDIKS